jgi:hypothetical protein
MKPIIYTILKLLSTSVLFISTTISAVEVTPLLGYRSGGEFIDIDTNQKHTVDGSEVYGLILGWPVEKGENFEVYYSHQSSKLRSVSVTIPTVNNTTDIPLTIDYLHFGGTAPIADEGNINTFVSGGLGFAYLSPDLTGLQSDLRASFSLGIGMKMPISENIAFRLETRALATLFNSNSALFCNGGCSLTVNGSLFWQTEVFAGLAIKF